MNNIWYKFQCVWIVDLIFHSIYNLFYLLFCSSFTFCCLCPLSFFSFFLLRFSFFLLLFFLCFFFFIFLLFGSWFFFLLLVYLDHLCELLKFVHITSKPVFDTNLYLCVFEPTQYFLITEYVSLCKRIFDICQ